MLWSQCRSDLYLRQELSEVYFRLACDSVDNVWKGSDASLFGAENQALMGNVKKVKHG
jgi:hypothetical protein